MKKSLIVLITAGLMAVTGVASAQNKDLIIALNNLDAFSVHFDTYEAAKLFASQYHCSDVTELKDVQRGRVVLSSCKGK